MKHKALMGASLFAAIAASLCCTLPLIAALAGIGVAGASAFFAAWRPYLLALTAGLLALGFYFAYRKPDRESCAPGSACEYPATSRYGRFGLWLVTALVVLFAAFPYYSLPLSRVLLSRNKVQATPVATIHHLSLAVEGMSCAVCAQGIEHRLNSINGVNKASVSYEKRTAEIDYDPRLVKLEELEQPFKDAGFKTTMR